MIEYLPWSNKISNECLKDYENGKYTILDIELGGQCNFKCIYCDSPHRDRKCALSNDKLEEVFKSKKIKWVYICGLGEPTFGANYDLLLFILSLCEKYNAKCSIFTNLSNLTKDLLSYIDKGILNLLFKYDSRDILKNAKIYGASSWVNKQILNVDVLKSHVKLENNCTNIAASIVVTQFNKNEIIEIVKDCLNSNIYPFIADLENSGAAQEYFNELVLTDEELIEIKNQISQISGTEYNIPVCPAVISGIHIRHDGNVTVDDLTGLSCHWFWLEEPRTYLIGSFNTLDIDEIIEKIEKFRTEKLEVVKSLFSKIQNKVFGGCGGDIKSLITHYLNALDRRTK